MRALILHCLCKHASQQFIYAEVSCSSLERHGILGYHRPCYVYFTVFWLTVKCKDFFQLYSYCFFQLLLQLQLLDIFELQLQLLLTDVHFSVITGFQLLLLLTGITLIRGF